MIFYKSLVDLINIFLIGLFQKDDNFNGKKLLEYVKKEEKFIYKYLTRSMYGTKIREEEAKSLFNYDVNRLIFPSNYNTKSKAENTFIVYSEDFISMIFKDVAAKLYFSESGEEINIMEIVSQSVKENIFLLCKNKKIDNFCEEKIGKFDSVQKIYENLYKENENLKKELSEMSKKINKIEENNDYIIENSEENDYYIDYFMLN